MKTDRRGFLAALIAAPLAAKILPLCCSAQSGVEHFIHSNVWDTSGVALTEKAFNDFFNERYTPIYRTPWGPLPEDGLSVLYAGEENA